MINPAESSSIPQHRATTFPLAPGHADAYPKGHQRCSPLRLNVSLAGIKQPAVLHQSQVTRN